MPACPVCRDEFEDDVTVCPSDDAVLVPVDELPPAPVGDAPLGVFHPHTAALVVRWLASKQVPVRGVELDDVRVQLVVPEPVRDELRASLVLQWGGFLRGLEPEQQLEVARAGGAQPGWHDAPSGGWIDDEGRLRVEATPDEEDVADASRTVGPTLAAVGVVILLLAWVTGWDAGPVLLGIGAVVLGLLLPR